MERMLRSLITVLLLALIFVGLLVPASRADQEATEALAGVWKLTAAYDSKHVGKKTNFHYVTLTKNGLFFTGQVEVKFEVEAIPMHPGEYQMYWFAKTTQERGATFKVLLKGETLLLTNAQEQVSWLYRRLAPNEKAISSNEADEPIIFEKMQ